jgi:hypothetical protein
VYGSSLEGESGQAGAVSSRCLDTATCQVCIVRGVLKSEAEERTPRREIHLYASQADWRIGGLGLTVYYLGVPDTTPEFTTEAALEAYLARPRTSGP